MKGGQALESTNDKLHGLFKELEEAKKGQNAGLTDEFKEVIRGHMTENQDLVRELQDRLRVAQEEADVQIRRRTDVEKMLVKRETAYEELLDKTASSQNMAVEDIKACPAVGAVNLGS
jgi:kinesin family protein 5